MNRSFGTSPGAPDKNASGRCFGDCHIIDSVFDVAPVAVYESSRRGTGGRYLVVGSDKVNHMRRVTCCER